MSDRLRAVVAGSVIWKALSPIGAAYLWLAAAIASLTRPGDWPARDGVTEDVFLHSRMIESLNRALAAIERSWTHSAARPLVDSIGRTCRPASAAGRVRMGGGLTVVAAVTVLALRVLATRREPLTWIVPAGATVAGVAAICFARSIAGAWAHRKA